MNVQKGFTLIEIIIVISIISILSVLGISSYQNIQKQSRDTKRISDINELVRAIQTYHLRTGNWPGEADTSGAQISQDCTSDLISDLLAEDTIKTVPNDPLGANVSCTAHDGDPVNVDDLYFYGWDSTHNGPYSYCISVNKVESDWGVKQLIDRYTQRTMTNEGGDANIGTGSSMQFNYCFLPN